LNDLRPRNRQCTRCGKAIQNTNSTGYCKSCWFRYSAETRPIDNIKASWWLDEVEGLTDEEVRATALADDGLLSELQEHDLSLRILEVAKRIREASEPVCGTRER